MAKYLLQMFCKIFSVVKCVQCLHLSLKNMNYLATLIISNFYFQDPEKIPGKSLTVLETETYSTGRSEPPSAITDLEDHQGLDLVVGHQQQHHSRLREDYSSSSQSQPTSTEESVVNVVTSITDLK